MVVSSEIGLVFVRHDHPFFLDKRVRNNNRELQSVSLAGRSEPTLWMGWHKKLEGAGLVPTLDEFKAEERKLIIHFERLMDDAQLLT